MAFSLRSCLLASTTLAALTGCGGSNTADALIGPEGGVVAHDDGVTLTVPAGALLVTRQIIIRPSDEKLSRGSFEQVGDAYLIEPRDLEFRVPAELTFDTDVSEKPTVLLKPGETRVIAYSASDDKPTAYIGTLGVVAAAKGSEPSATVDSPKLARTPADTNLKAAAIDVAELKVTPKGVTSVDVGLTAFDPSGESKGLLIRLLARVVGLARRRRALVGQRRVDLPEDDIRSHRCQEKQHQVRDDVEIGD